MSQENTSQKIAVAVLSDPKAEHQESLGRLFNALVAAYDFHQSGATVQILFQGTGTRWLGQIVKEDHPAHELYQNVKDLIVGASCGCADAFGASEEVVKSGFDLIKDSEVPGTSGVTNLPKLVADGYTIINY